MRTPRQGWTLKELLVVVAVFSILIGLTLPVILKVREAAQRSACLNNLRQLTLAVHTYHDTTGHIPPYSTGQAGTKVHGGWWIHLMAYVSEEPFHRKILEANPIRVSGEAEMMTPLIFEPGYQNARFAVLNCGSDPSAGLGPASWGTTNYLANWYVFGDGVFGCYVDPRSFRDVHDGLGGTVLFAEGYAFCNNLLRPALVACCTHNFGVTWHGKPSDDPSYAPTDYTLFQSAPPIDACDNQRAQTPHSAMPVALADGGSRLVVRTIDPSGWKQMLKPRDGGPLGLE